MRFWGNTPCVLGVQIEAFQRIGGPQSHLKANCAHKVFKGTRVGDVSGAVPKCIPYIRHRSASKPNVATRHESLVHSHFASLIHKQKVTAFLSARTAMGVPGNVVLRCSSRGNKKVQSCFGRAVKPRRAGRGPSAGGGSVPTPRSFGSAAQPSARDTALSVRAGFSETAFFGL